MLTVGKYYTDKSGKKLPQMNQGDEGFWIARDGDHRYFNEDGTCIAVLGEGNNAASLTDAEWELLSINLAVAPSNTPVLSVS